MKRLLLVFLILGLFGCLAAGCGDDDGGPNSCSGLCDYTDVATAQQAQCVGNYLESQGYSIWLNPVCNNVSTESECNACYANIGASDSHCAAAWDQCW
jgi:hypothetical protein